MLDVKLDILQFLVEKELVALQAIQEIRFGELVSVVICGYLHDQPFAPTLS